MSIQEHIFKEISYTGDKQHAIIVGLGVTSFLGAIVIDHNTSGDSCLPMVTALVVSWGVLRTLKCIASSCGVNTQHT